MSYSNTLKLYHEQNESNPYNITVNNNSISEFSTTPIQESAASIKFIRSTDGQYINDICTEFNSISTELSTNRSLALTLLGDATADRIIGDRLFNTNLTIEKNARIAGYNAIASNIVTNNTATNTQIAAVSSSRVVSLYTLTNNINSQRDERKSSDTDLTSSLNTFVNSNNAALDVRRIQRIIDDSTIESSINGTFTILNNSNDAHKTKRVSDMNIVQSSLNTEIANFSDQLDLETSRISALIARLATDTQNINQTITNYQNADTNILDSIIGLNSTLTTLNNNFLLLKDKVDTAIESGGF